MSKLTATGLLLLSVMILAALVWLLRDPDVTHDQSILHFKRQSDRPIAKVRDCLLTENGREAFSALQYVASRDRASTLIDTYIGDDGSRLVIDGTSGRTTVSFSSSALMTSAQRRVLDLCVHDRY